MSVFAQALEVEKNPVRHCRLMKLVLDQKDPEREAILSALGNNKITAAAISRALVVLDIAVGRGGVDSHRRGDCACRS